MRHRLLFSACVLSTAACTPSAPGVIADPVPRPPVAGELLIEELYYSGAEPNGGADHYFSDQFVELVNVSEGPLDISGVLVADVFGAAGAINPGMEPDSFADRQPDEVVLGSVWRIPDGTVLEQFEQIVLAHDGTNHRPFSTVDLTGAAFEAYVESSGGDDDHPTVANLESVSFDGGYDWLITVFGPSVVVLSADTELGTRRGHPNAPVSAVLDAIETVMDADSGDFKRLPDSVDAGFAYVSGTYTGESLHRRLTDDGWQDTDDSGADFEVGPPDPGGSSISTGVFGDPFVELGTGTDTFVALEPDDAVELVAGQQGGWHLDAAVRFGGVSPVGLKFVYDAVDTSGERVSYVTQTTLGSMAVLEDDEGWIRVGDRVVLDIDSADEVVGASLVLRVTLDHDGQTWSDERTITVVDDQ